jgi:hypothetical protein
MKRLHSRVDHRVWRAFMALEGEASTGQLVHWVWPTRERFEPWMYFRCRTAAAELGDPVRRAGTKGRPVAMAAQTADEDGC